MRGRIFRIILTIAAILVVLKVAFRIHAFVNLFFGHSGYSMTQEAIAAAHNDSDTRTARIPKIVHQIFHDFNNTENTQVPTDWLEGRVNCVRLNEDWDFQLWNVQDSRAFIETEYPWFVETYDNYPYPVQRTDALRYFLLRHFGGMYMDLDNTCITSLEAIRYYPAWTTDGGHGMLSNNLLAAEPGHPWFVMMTESLIPYSWHYILPYLTIMYASGQWFETEIWEKYHATLPAGDPGLLRMEMDGRPGAAKWFFFAEGRGGTWNNWDNRVFEWTGEHPVVFGLCIATICLSVTVALCALLRRMRRSDNGSARAEQHSGYSLLN